MLGSEKDLDDLRIPGGIGKTALEYFLAGVHDDDAVGDLIDEPHQMLDDEKRDAGTRQLLQLRRDMLQFGGIEAGGKLIDQQQPRAGRKRAGEVKHLLMRAVEFGRGLVGKSGEAERRQ